MPATFTIPVVTPVDDDLITADLWNNEFENIYTNLTPAGMDDYSATDGEMQTTTDPYPGSVVSRPTSLQGELERIRYLIKQVTGKTYWYQDPDTDLTALFPPTTVMVFYQAAAPTGWTQVTTQNDKALRVVSGSGGGTGGSQALSSAITLAHTHTVASHTHTIAHKHVVPVGYVTASTIFFPQGAEWGAGSGSDSSAIVSAGGSNGGASARDYAKSKDSDTADSGAASPATDSQLSNITLAYIDVIIASKD